MNALRHAFAYPWLLSTLAALPILALLAALAQQRRVRDLARFGPLALARGLQARPRLRGFCLTGGLTLLAVAVAGPQWGRDWSQSTSPGRDVVVVLDTSRSMFAEAPTRLERARLMALDLASSLRQRGGNRVGLVVFAARAKLACPLTHDLDHFVEVVKDIEADGPDPDLEYPDQPSGTRIGRGIIEGVKALTLDGGSAGARDILLLSDGDDPGRADGEWRTGARVAKMAGIPVHCIGIGDEVPRPIPGADGTPLVVGGKEVRTRLEEAPLREVATMTGGELKVAGTRPLALGDYYFSTLASASVREDNPDALPQYRPRYRWFLLPAFVLLLATLLLPDARPRGGRS